MLAWKLCILCDVKYLHPLMHIGWRSSFQALKIVTINKRSSIRLRLAIDLSSLNAMGNFPTVPKI